MKFVFGLFALYVVLWLGLLGAGIYLLYAAASWLMGH